MFHEVAQVIGRAAAAKLQAKFGGREIYVPARNTDAIVKRNKAIRSAYTRKTKPATIEQLMALFRLSRRQIWNIIGASA